MRVHIVTDIQCCRLCPEYAFSCSSIGSNSLCSLINNGIILCLLDQPRDNSTLHTRGSLGFYIDLFSARLEIGPVLFMVWAKYNFPRFSVPWWLESWKPKNPKMNTVRVVRIKMLKLVANEIQLNLILLSAFYLNIALNQALREVAK